MPEAKILLEIARARFEEEAEQKEEVYLSDIPEANALVNDLEHYPHAYVLACLMDRQIKAERAWSIPYRIQQLLGSFEIGLLAEVSENVYKSIFQFHSFHRFNAESAAIFRLGVIDIIEKYEGNAANIWHGNPSSAAVVRRFMEFRGAGPKISTMAANILARQFRIPFSDYSCIDISPDVHIQRVLKRMGLVDENASLEAIVMRARELNPEFPGLIDFSCWEIGRAYCRPSNPNCKECLVREECSSALSPSPA